MGHSVVSLFAGPGGMDLASRSMGHECVGIEFERNAVATRRAAGLETVHGDVTEFGPKDFPNRTMLTAGPPCQTFSRAGTGTGRVQMQDVIDAVQLMGSGSGTDARTFQDRRTMLVLEPLRWIIDAYQRDQGYQVVLLEQVPAVLPVWNAYADVLRKLGYHVDTGVMNVEQYGLAQTRRRAVLIARQDVPVSIPDPTHRKFVHGKFRDEGDAQLLPWATMADVLPERPWFRVVSNYGSGGDPRNRGVRRCDEPAFTVTGKFRKNRLVGVDNEELPRLSDSEGGILQGFPSDYPWSGSYTDQQIGNACPPPVAELLLKAVCDEA